MLRVTREYADVCLADPRTPAEVPEGEEFDLLTEVYKKPILREVLRDPLEKKRAVATIGNCDAIGALAPVVPLLSADEQHEDELTRRTAIALHAVDRDHSEAAVPALIRACDNERLLDAALLALIDVGKSAQPAAPCFRRFATTSKVLAFSVLNALRSAPFKTPVKFRKALCPLTPPKATRTRNNSTFLGLSRCEKQRMVRKRVMHGEVTYRINGAGQTRNHPSADLH
ncbi:MAG: hypothetical protein KDB11_33550 [Planctomycetales bacterium]|nr:hypothetical protein [Planctomycetales bacterium]